MCVNCDLTAPIKHYICDVLGIERNRYGAPASCMKHLEFFLTRYHYDLPTKETPSPLQTYIKENGLFEQIFVEINRDKQGAGPMDLSIINFVLAGYFHIDTKDVPTDLLDSLRIPIDKLTDDPTYLRTCFSEVKYTQQSPIPRKVLANWKIDESYIRERAKMYDIQLLDDPFTDDEPSQEVHIHQHPQTI